MSWFVYTLQDAHIYLLEDGLELWQAVLQNVHTMTDGLLKVYRNIPSLLECASENLNMALSITKLYLLLDARLFLTVSCFWNFFFCSCPVLLNICLLALPTPLSNLLQKYSEFLNCSCKLLGSHSGNFTSLRMVNYLLDCKEKGGGTLRISELKSWMRAYNLIIRQF